MRLKEVQLRIDTIINELTVLRQEISRRKPVRRAPPSSTPMTPKLEVQIRAFARANPTWSFAKIGEHFNVNGGRVSEAVRGKRK